jgi:calcium-binding protein CML
MFNHFDKNGDGKISAAELRQCWYAIGMRKLAEDADVLVASLDTDGDGLLRFDHFVKLMEGENEQDRLNDLEEAIEMYDMDDFVLLDSKVSHLCLSVLTSYLKHKCNNLISFMALYKYSSVGVVLYIDGWEILRLHLLGVIVR